jgi:hypothetical protein
VRVSRILSFIVQKYAEIEFRKLRKEILVPSLAYAGNSPRIGLFVLVEQGLQSLVLLELAQLRRVGEAEERRGELNEPFRVDCRHFPHVFLRCLDQFVIDHPGDRKFDQL